MVHAMTASRSVTIDFLDKETLIDPYTPLAALRDQDPVHWSEKHRSWVITRYDDVLAGIKSIDLSVEPGMNFWQTFLTTIRFVVIYRNGCFSRDH